MVIYTCKISVDAVCSVPNYYVQNSFYIYLVPFLLYRICILLAYKAALFVTSVSKLSSSCGADMRIGDS